MKNITYSAIKQPKRSEHRASMQGSNLHSDDGKLNEVNSMKLRLIYGFNDPDHAVFCDLENEAYIGTTLVYIARCDDGSTIQAPSDMFKIA